ncbi:hypothetical protein CDD83_10600 [Cordyceps sp. RAO-2017]|nr:hypothetical protein CDD83_10600 [Cordyceps sp. RAO-2017]
MTDPEAEVQATANLSPVSPAPVHTAAPRVVPALQDTVDTIDAMVSAAAAAAAAAAADTAAPNGVAGFDTAMLADAASANDLVDDDSLDDAYADDDDAASAPDTGLQPQPELPDSNDDYAKTFDSPMDPEEGGEQGHHPPQHISAAPTTTAAADAAVAAAAAQGTASPSEARADPSMEPSDPPAGPQQPDAAANSESAYAESQDSSVDIQKLVADLTAQPTEASSDAAPSPPPVAATKAEPPLGSAPLSSSISLPAASSLPPRPPQPQSGAQTYTSQQHAAGPSPTAAVVPSAGTVPPTTSGFVSEPASSLPAPPAAGLNAASAAAPLNAPAHTFQTAPGYSKDGEPDADYQRQWEQFMSDERQYMSDAKWDRFPEGSRIFIGNLSSDKVSKRDVFDVFYKYGRLAQISLKSAYGFVQYHAVDEGRQAMENLQGIEIKGRRIHLEVSRVQDKGKKDRGRSNDRASRRRGEKHQHHQGRDDYRPGRNSPRRNDYHARDENFGRSRGYESARGAGRGRSRSPEYGRNDRDSYRRRSPSPYGRGRHEAELDLPRRYGADVPDVQIILQPEVNRDFVTWVEAAFKAKGLKTEVMYLHPRFPKDQIIQRQAAEGVYGVVDLDLRAQGLGRIPVQAFDRSGAGSNVRFDQYLRTELLGRRRRVPGRVRRAAPAAAPRRRLS